MTDAAAPIARTNEDPGCLRLTRAEIQTIAAVDIGWIVDDTSATPLMHFRGRTQWLDGIATMFDTARYGFHACTRTQSAYSRSHEFGRPTFSEWYIQNHMPLEFRPVGPDDCAAGVLAWKMDSIRLSVNGSLSVHILTQISPDYGDASAVEVVDSYHLMRREVRQRWSTLLTPFFSMWNASLTEYPVDAGRLDELAFHCEYYDLVDIDFTVDGHRASPKSVYRGGPLGALRAIAGITRMSRVMGDYAAPALASIAANDLGNREDELWIVNGERLTRHHGQHLSDSAKRLFWTDVSIAVEILLEHRAALSYVADWVNRQRSIVLDALIEPAGRDETTTMHHLLQQVVWMSDLYSNLQLPGEKGSTSFFATLADQVAEYRDVQNLASDVRSTVDHVLSLAQAVFAERVASYEAARSQADTGIFRRTLYIGAIACGVALLSLIVATVGVWR